MLELSRTLVSKEHEMDRRNFLGAVAATGIGTALNPRISMAAEAPAASDLGLQLQTKHLIYFITGNGSRKKEWYESPEVCPNAVRISKEGFTYYEDHSETATSHGTSWTELLTGVPVQTGIPIFPTIPHYVRKAYGDEASKYWYLNGVSYYRQWRFNVKYFTSHPSYGEETRPTLMTTRHIFFEGNKKRPEQIVEEQFPDMGLTAPEKKRLAEFIAGALASKDWNPTGLKNPPIPYDPYLSEAQSLEILPKILQEFKPRILLWQQVGHDCGHGAGGYLRQETGWTDYSHVARTTDEQIGRIFDFIKKDPYFSKNTAIVIRPEFGRDDEINMYGEINHTDGYYYSHRSASIFWGPDIKPGKSGLVVNRHDIAKTIPAMLNADAPYSTGQIRSHMFKDHVGKLPEYRPYTPA